MLIVSAMVQTINLASDLAMPSKLQLQHVELVPTPSTTREETSVSSTIATSRKSSARSKLQIIQETIGIIMQLACWLCVSRWRQIPPRCLSVRWICCGGSSSTYKRGERIVSTPTWWDSISTIRTTTTSSAFVMVWKMACIKLTRILTCIITHHASKDRLPHGGRWLMNVWWWLLGHVVLSQWLLKCKRGRRWWSW